MKYIKQITVLTLHMWRLQERQTALTNIKTKERRSEEDIRQLDAELNANTKEVVDTLHAIKVLEEVSA